MTRSNEDVARTGDGGAPSALSSIRHLDYTIIFARDLPAMRRFYRDIMGFPVHREMGESWFEYRVGASILALTRRGPLFDDPAPPAGALSLQLAFRVPPRVVDECAAELRARGVSIVFEPTDQPWGHRTLFFRDPDGNVLEIYADL
jgi:catechol 2,3-dioxygenase-like lactoylglutathione lyase family enzyme